MFYSGNYFDPQFLQQDFHIHGIFNNFFDGIEVVVDVCNSVNNAAYFRQLTHHPKA
jgi:hypothetical protein